VIAGLLQWAAAALAVAVLVVGWREVLPPRHPAADPGLEGRRR
jgi:hypothetical protein